MTSKYLHLAITPRLHASQEEADAFISAYVDNAIKLELPGTADTDSKVAKERLLHLISLVVYCEHLLCATCVRNERERDQEEDEQSINLLIVGLKCERTKNRIHDFTERFFHLKKRNKSRSTDFF